MPNMKNISITLLLLSQILSASNDIFYKNQESDNKLIAKAILSNNKKIVENSKKIEQILKILNSQKNNEHSTIKKVEKNKYNAVVKKVKHYANFREKPFGEISLGLRRGTKIFVDKCNIKVKSKFWCHSTSYGGGYISQTLVQMVKKKKQIKKTNQNTKNKNGGFIVLNKPRTIEETIKMIGQYQNAQYIIDFNGNVPVNRHIKIRSIKDLNIYLLETTGVGLKAYKIREGVYIVKPHYFGEK